MDLHTITRMLNAIATEGNVNQFQVPPLVLEAFLPGYSSISRLVCQVLGFDIGYVVSLALLLIALTKAWGYLALPLPPLILDHVTSAVYLGNYNHLFYISLDWIAEKPAVHMARNLVARTKYGARVENDYLRTHKPGTGERFHFGKRASKVSTRYQPNFGSKVFFDNHSEDILGGCLVIAVSCCVRNVWCAALIWDRCVIPRYRS